MSEQILNVVLSKIHQTNNSRQIYDPDEMAELMTSMKQTGLLQPVGIRKTKNGEWDLVFGNRRYRAATKLGWKTIPAVEVNSDTDSDKLVMNLVENLQRSNPSLLEQGRLYEELKLSGMTETEIAARLGVNITKIRQGLLNFKTVPDEFRNKIVSMGKGERTKKGKIPGSAVVAIEAAARKGIINTEEKKMLYRESQNERMTTARLNSVLRLARAGTPVEEAIAAADEIELVQIVVAIHQDDARKIEKSKGCSIRKALHMALANAVPQIISAKTFSRKTTHVGKRTHN